MQRLIDVRCHQVMWPMWILATAAAIGFVFAGCGPAVRSRPDRVVSTEPWEIMTEIVGGTVDVDGSVKSVTANTLAVSGYIECKYKRRTWRKRRIKLLRGGSFRRGMRWESSEWMVDKVETTPVETVFEAEAPRKVRIESAALSTHIVVNVSEDGFFESGPLRTRMGMMPLPARPDDKVQKISVPLRIVPLGIENARNHATLSVECYRYWNREKAEIASARLREISKRKKWSWREIMRLVQQGGDVQALNEKGYSILHHAAIHGHSDDIPYLVWRGANVNAGDDSEGVRIVIQASRRRATPLSSAITKGHPKAVEALIAAGANVNYRVADTPVLNLAAEKGVLSIVKALINAGAKVNAQVGSPRYRRTLGASALYEAARNGHADIVKFLLDSSANPNASISIYSSPTSVLLGACTRSRDAKTEVQKQGYIETVKLLIKAGADVNFRTRKKGAHDTAISNTYGTSVDNDGRLYNPKPHTGASKAIYVLLKEAGAR